MVRDTCMPDINLMAFRPLDGKPLSATDDILTISMQSF